MNDLLFKPDGLRGSYLASFRCFIPGKPGHKGRPRFTSRGGFGRAYTDTKTANYETLVRLRALEEVGPDWELLEGPLYLKIDARFGFLKSWSKKKASHARAGAVFHTTRPDLDNIVKVIKDALNGVIWKDDAQIVAILAYKCYGEPPGVKVEVERVKSLPGANWGAYLAWVKKTNRT